MAKLAQMLFYLFYFLIKRKKFDAETCDVLELDVEDKIKYLKDDDFNRVVTRMFDDPHHSEKSKHLRNG